MPTGTQNGGYSRWFPRSHRLSGSRRAWVLPSGRRGGGEGAHRDPRRRGSRRRL